MDLEILKKVLEQNKDKGFVQRILNPSNYPVLDLAPGKTATHMMSWGKVDNKYIAFPTILYDENIGLTQYSPNEAFSHVMQTNNYIVFDTAKEAEWFSKNYKQVWKKQRRK